MRTLVIQALFVLVLSLVAAGANMPSAQASLTVPVTAPVTLPHRPSVPVITTDFSDADFAAADRPETGAVQGGSGHLNDQELILIVVGAVLLLILLIILIA